MSNQQRINRLKKRNDKILSKFMELNEKKFAGKKLYTKEAILAMLSDEFFLSTNTIDDIVFGRIEY